MIFFFILNIELEWVVTLNYSLKKKIVKSYLALIKVGLLFFFSGHFL